MNTIDLGPDPEFDEYGNPTTAWSAAYAAWLEDRIALEDDEVDDGQDDVDDAADDAPEGAFYDWSTGDDFGVDAAPDDAVVATEPAVAGKPSQAWMDDYDARHGLVFPEAERRSWPAWLRPRLPRRRERGELVMAAMGAEPLTGVLVPSTAGPAAPTPPPEVAGPVTLLDEIWAAVVENAERVSQWWTTAVETRREERAETLPLVADAARAFQRARRLDPHGTAAATHTAQRVYKAAKRAVPQPMGLVATEALLAAVGACTAAWVWLVPRVPVADWWWTGLGAAALLGSSLMWMVVRRRRRPVGLVPTAEERRLLGRLRTSHWVTHAERRGLSGTVTGDARLTEAGIVAAVRLDGKTTPTSLAAAEENIRALLGARTGLRIEIKPGSHGGWAELTLRTRSAADGVNLAWSTEAEGIGLDTVTGRPVPISLDARIIVCGSAGAGKSWSTRPLLAAAMRIGHVVMIDGKGEEATIWANVIRTAVEPAEIMALVREVTAEAERRKADMKRRGISVWDGPQLTVLVDEGRVILAMKNKTLTKALIDLSALGRSRGVVLWWATQYPTTSGDAPGIHPQISANTDVRIALRVKNETHARVALDDDADYGPQFIRRDQKGRLYVGGHGPHQVQAWTMTDEQVKALPPGFWHFAGAGEEAAAELGAANLAQLTASRRELEAAGIGDGAELPAAPVDVSPAAAGLVGNDARVLDALVSAGEPLRQSDIVAATGLNKGSVSKAVTRLVKADKLTKNPDGTIQPAGH